jgi:dTDP-4-dehydrorhamnose 3,5-epimerase
VEIEPTALEGVWLLTPRIHSDERGYFFESFRESVFADLGLPTEFKQDNQAGSKRGVLRGLHYQLRYSQGKLVRVTFGEVYDVAVDLRRGSPTFGEYVGIHLSDRNHRMVYIPEGFAHGYCVLSERAIFQYKCTQVYHPEDEYGIRWDDPQLAIDWPLDQPVVSPKDAQLPRLKEMDPELLPAYEGRE